MYRLLRFQDERLCVDVQAVALLRSLPKKVTLVGVAGVARSGKSSLINLLLPEDTPSEELFCTGDSSESCTAGMWMSARPVTIGDHQVLLIDSEGLATGNTTHHPGMLCVLSMICTVLMINEMRQINVTSLTNLETLTAARDMMRGDSGAHWPALCFVVRDHRLKLPEGLAGTTPESYDLEERVLKPQSDRHDEVRQTIRECFTLREMVTLTTPSDAELDAFPRLEEGKFKKSFTKLKEVLESLLEAKSRDSCTFDGPMLADLIENLVKDLNGAGVVDIPSLTQVVHEKRCQKECQFQFKTYETAMVLESGTQIPAAGLLSSLPGKAIDWTKIDETHQRESELALDRYDQAIHSLKPDAREKFRKDLQKDMQHLLDGVKESARQIHKARIQAAERRDGEALDEARDASDATWAPSRCAPPPQGFAGLNRGSVRMVCEVVTDPPLEQG
ncbi:hypothetical protein CYMTET_21616 [Cymbomonas tetramitiformis]|uniref:Guanylate-binding protein N-terminal domain-containing protein n=1 Tax=Cymbomonas tetramitiformis TaxID=36881 RepID=A0AAE0G1U7_9CHLO|nr:hypothetical protein CYMTET_21616 [Cymbomonas tetramitiformis]